MKDKPLLDVEDLAVAIEKQHGGRATFIAVEPIDERHNDQPVWQGHVHVFDLDGHPTVTRAHAWLSPIEGSSKRRFYAVLHLGPIRSARDVVRAAIVAEAKGGTGDNE